MIVDLRMLSEKHLKWQRQRLDASVGASGKKKHAHDLKILSTSSVHLPMGREIYVVNSITVR